MVLVDLDVLKTEANQIHKCALRISEEDSKLEQVAGWLHTQEFENIGELLLTLDELDGELKDCRKVYLNLADLAFSIAEEYRNTDYKLARMMKDTRN